MTKSRRTIRDRDILDPSKILGKLVSDYTDGNLDDKVFLYRAQVVGIDLVGGQLETEPAPNPPGSVKARILSLDRYKTDDDLTVFWPLFPYDLMPIKENEHVYVLFEDQEGEHGLWISRIPEPNNVNKLNKTFGSTKYEEDSSNEIDQSVSVQQQVLDLDEAVTAVSGSGHFVTEDVPKYTGRVGDRLIHGSNNTLISLGRDRVTDVASGLTEGAGTIDLVTGRDGINNNFDEDKSRIYISSNTNPDENFSIDGDPQASESPSIVIKSNEIRILARSNTKIINEDGVIIIQTPGNITIQGDEVTIEGSSINVGQDAQEAMVYGDKLKTLLNAIIQALMNHFHASSMGPTSPSSDLAAALGPKLADVQQLTSQTVKVK